MPQPARTLSTPLRARDVQRRRGPPSLAGHVCVLVVEDDAAIRALLQEAFEAAGFGVCVAPDGLAALNRVRRGPPDVVILDLGLPRLDGQEFVDAWRTAAPTDNVPIVVLSATAALPPLLASVGVQGHITKPFDIDMVVETVRRVASDRS
jgi:CheY-like chemotaxis protein